MWTAVDHFRKGILAWTLGDHSAETFEPLWTIVAAWQCYFYVTDGWIRQFKDEMQRGLMKQRILRKGCDSQEIFSVCDL